MEREIATRQLRDKQADLLDAVQYTGDVLIVTRRGRKAAAVVPLAMLATLNRQQANQRKDNGLSVTGFGPPAGLPEHQLNTTILTRDELADRLRERSSKLGVPDVEMTAGETDAVVGMLRELAGLFADEKLGNLAGELAVLLDSRKFVAEQQR